MKLKLKEKPQNPSVFERKLVKSEPLKHIIQLTEEYETTRYNKESSSIHHEKLISKLPEREQLSVQSWKRHFCCFRYFCRLFAQIMGQSKQMNVNETQLTELIDKIRTKKSSLNFILPPQSEAKKVLVLDLDETLIHSTFNKPDKYDFQAEICFNGRITKIYTVKRFGLDAFLFQMSKIYQIIVFTASQKQYADKMVSFIDPRKRISHVLSRDDCIIINRMYYLKNLKLLGRDLKQIILVDDNKMAGILQPENFYKIDQFLGSPKDRKLLQLGSFLKHISNQKNIVPITQNRKKFEDIQIKVREQILSKSPLHFDEHKKSARQKRRYSRHKKTNSESQHLFDIEIIQGDMEKEKDQSTQPSESSQIGHQNQNAEQSTANDLILQKN